MSLQSYNLVEGLSFEQLSDILVDSLLGVLYGAALGDAYGLSTEFMTKKEIESVYGKNVPVPFPNYQKTDHNSRWISGDHTDDFDQLLLILETIVEATDPTSKLSTTSKQNVVTPKPSVDQKNPLSTNWVTTFNDAKGNIMFDFNVADSFSRVDLKVSYDGRTPLLITTPAKLIGSKAYAGQLDAVIECKGYPTVSMQFKNGILISQKSNHKQIETAVPISDFSNAHLLFAYKLLEWIKHGYPELGDTAGMGLGALTSAVSKHPDFLTNPHKASDEVYRSRPDKSAANGALMRTAVIGCFQSDDLSKVVSNSDKFCKVTHSDPKCIASCRLISVLIAFILQTKKKQQQSHKKPTMVMTDSSKTDSKSDLKESAFVNYSFDDAMPLATSIFDADPKTKADNVKEFQKWCDPQLTLSDLKLDDSKTIGYTYKAMACALYGLRSTKSFIETLQPLVLEGGDADSNGIGCGALWGARFGYQALPKQWLAAMPHKKWIDAKITKFINLIV